MYKLAAGAVVFTAWSVFFLMGVSRVGHAGGDGDGGDGDSAGNVANFYAAAPGSKCVCTANSTTCLCDFAYKIGTVRATAVKCGPCAAGSAADCRVCTPQPIRGNSCTCQAAASGADGDGAKDGDGTAREAFALGDGDTTGDGAKTVGDSTGGAAKAGDSAGDGAKAGDSAGDGAKAGDSTGDGAKAGDSAGDGAKAGDSTGDAAVVKPGDADGDAHADGDGASCAAGEIAKHQCTCDFAYAAGDGDAHADGDGAKGGARQAFALGDGDTAGDGAKAGDGDTTGDGAKTVGDSTGDAAKAGDSAGDGAKAGDSAGDGAKAGDSTGDAAVVKPGDADGDAHADGDGKGKGKGAGFECCCLKSASGDGGDTTGDAAGKDTCTCKLEKLGASSDGDGDATTKDGDGTSRYAVTLDGGDNDGDGDGVFRPKYGMINGQGCTGRAGCKGSTKQPYYVWTKFVQGDKHTRGGQIYFEWRGDHGMAIGLLMMAWVALFVLMGLVAVVMRMQGVEFRRLCGPLVPGSVASLVESLMLVPLRVSVAELAVCLWVVGWLVLTFLYVWNHAYINNLVGPIPRAIGGMVAGLLTLMLFPVARQSVLLVSFGIPFERALAFHRRMGVWVLVLMLAHFFGMLISHAVYYHHGEPNRPARVYYPGVGRAEAGRKAMARMLKWEIGYPHGPPLAGFIALFVMLAIAVAAAVRRSHWNLFAVVHSLYAVLYVLSWIHYPSLMVWSAVPLLLYVGDLFLRNAQAFCNKARIVSVDTYDSGVTCVTFVRKQAFVPGPAQWVSVRIPSAEKSVAEWHPFSVSSVAQTDEGTRFTIHCKKMGEGEWTDRIRSQQLEGADALVQGPFGSPMIDVDGADSLLLVAGGVGITAVLGTLSYLAARNRLAKVSKQITVVWTVRGEAMEQAFAQQIAAVINSGLELRLHIHDSLKAVSSSSGSPKKVPQYFSSQARLPSFGQTHNNGQGATEFGRRGSVVQPLMPPVVGKMLPPDAALESPSYRAQCDPEAVTRCECVEHHGGRPELASYVSQAPVGTRVLACGPGPLLYSVESEARVHGFAVHTEVFEF